jgi:hypothetical protein
MIEISTTPSWRYNPRTIINAESSTLTLLFCVDKESAGTKLTKRYAKNYFVIDANNPVEIEFGKLIKKYPNEDVYDKLNIAGNGISTFEKYDITQSQLNYYVYSFLCMVYATFNITHIRSGGQTGADIAGISASKLLLIDSSLLMPAKHRQRLSGYVDKYYENENQFIESMEQQIKINSYDMIMLPRNAGMF